MASSASGSVIVATLHDVGPALDRDGLTDGRGVRDVDPVAVRLLEQLRLLVLGGGIQPEPGGLQREAATLLTDAALAHVEHLLAVRRAWTTIAHSLYAGAIRPQ